MTADTLENSESRDVTLASERQLVWARFRRHKLALISTVIVGLFYLVAFGAEFVAVNDPVETDAIEKPPRPKDQICPSMNIDANPAARLTVSF